MPPKLTDNEVHERIYKALIAVGTDDAETVRGETALEAARRALTILMFGLVKSMDDGTDTVEGVIPDRRDS